MSAEKAKQSKAAQSAAEKSYKIANPEEKIQEGVDKLMNWGGFDMVEALLPDSSWFNPENGAAYLEVFLTDSDKTNERNDLKSQISSWLDILDAHADVEKMIEQCESDLNEKSTTFNKNVLIALKSVKELEVNWTSLDLFFRNTGQEKVRNFRIVNAGVDNVNDFTQPGFIKAIQTEISRSYDQLDLRDNYSLLVIPGWLGKSALDEWARFAFANKVMLVTDYADKPGFKMLTKDFDKDKLTSGDLYKSNVILTANYLVSRKKHEEVGELMDVTIPPSGTQAGLIYGTLISQPSAGFTHGSLRGVEGVSLDLTKSEINELEQRGLVPITEAGGKIMSYSAKTLYNGSDLGLQTYSVVRVFDYVGKVLVDFCNRQAFRNWSTKVEKELKKEINRYLDSIKGHGKAIEKFSLINLTQDKTTKAINIDLHITPFFPAKNFLIKMGGTQGDSAESWATEYLQQD